MELKEFLEVIRKNLALIVVVTAVFLIAGVSITYLIPNKYSSSIDVYVSRRATKETDQYYTYDGYYSTQSSVQYASTVSGLFQSLQIVRDAAGKVQTNNSYQKSEEEPANLSEDVKYLKDVQSKILVEDVAPQIITVSFKDEDLEKSKIWVMSLGEAVKEKVDEVNSNSDGKFKVDMSALPLVEEVSPSLVINIVVSLMSGVLVGTLWAFGKKYFNKK